MREICILRKGPKQSPPAPFVFVQGACSPTNKDPALTNSEEDPFIGAELDESKVFEDLSLFEVSPSFTQTESKMEASGSNHAHVANSRAGRQYQQTSGSVRMQDPGSCTLPTSQGHQSRHRRSRASGAPFLAGSSGTWPGTCL
jgi:hypothetical protein